MQIINLLDKKDIYFCFDFKDNVDALMDDLKSGKFNVMCEIIDVGNSRKEYDSYNWNLSNLIFGMRKQKLNTGIFDVVYLDGAHTFLHDGLAVCLLKELIKVGGFLILDDVHWTYSSSEGARKFANGKLTTEQMEDKQILRVQEIFLSNDPHFKKLSPDSAWRSVFIKI